MIISWDDYKFIRQLWSSINYKLCKLLQICLQRPLYFLNVLNYNWLPYNNSFILINIGVLDGEPTFLQLNLSPKATLILILTVTKFDHQCLIWFHFSLKLLIFVDYLINWPMVSIMTESPEMFSAIWSIPLQKGVGFFPSALLFSLLSYVLPKSSGGGMTTLLFTFNRVDRLIGLRLFPSLASSTVSGCEIIIASTSAIKIRELH